MAKTFRAPATFHYIAFYDLLADAVFQHRCAASEADSFRMNRYARASIVAAALGVECAANCLLHSLSLSSILHSELDKLPALAKIETFLKFSDIGSLDRGRVEVQKIKELVSARNEYVHPKISTIEASVEKPEDRGHEWHVPFCLEGENWPGLQMPKKAMFWSRDSSQSTLSAIAAFFKYLFVDLMEASHEQLQGILPSHIAVGDMHILAVFDEFKREIASATEFGADFSFLGLSVESAK